jgi:hypothetical protein
VIDCCINCKGNARTVFQNVVVPKSQNTVAFRSEIGRSPLIGSILRVLTAVEFDANPELMAGEVGEVTTYRRLASKVMSLERGLPEMLPKLLFRFGRGSPQSPSARDAQVSRTL